MNVKFIRYGGLSSVNHKKFYKKDGFHAPPRKRGIYAFLFPYVEIFLWRWKVHDKKLNVKKRIFEYSGEIWTHFIEEAKQLGCGCDYNKTWVKMHTDDLNACFKLVKSKDRLQLMMDSFNNQKIIHDPYKRGLGGWMACDHLEIFIEKV